MARGTQYFEADNNIVIGGLATACGGLILFIKNQAVRFVIKRNNDIEKRLSSLETGVSFLMGKTKEINHKLDNKEAGEAGAFQVILDRLDDIEKKRERRPL